MREKDDASRLKYTIQRNKVKKIIRNDLRIEQNTIARQYKSNPKKFWKYVNSKNRQKKLVI